MDGSVFSSLGSLIGNENVNVYGSIVQADEADNSGTWVHHVPDGFLKYFSAPKSWLVKFSIRKSYSNKETNCKERLLMLPCMK